MDARSGELLYSRYGTRSVVPASDTKIVTAVAALHTLGPGYRFSTEVIRRGVVVGGSWSTGYADDNHAAEQEGQDRHHPGRGRGVRHHRQRHGDLREGHLRFVLGPAGGTTAWR